MEQQLNQIRKQLNPKKKLNQKGNINKPVSHGGHCWYSIGYVCHSWHSMDGSKNLLKWEDMEQVN